VERVLQGILLSGLILFFTLATWALVEDWQAWAAVNHPELQWDDLRARGLKMRGYADHSQ